MGCGAPSGLQQADEGAAGAGGGLGVAEVGVELVEALLAAGAAQQLHLGIGPAEEAEEHPSARTAQRCVVQPVPRSRRQDQRRERLDSGKATCYCELD